MADAWLREFERHLLAVATGDDPYGSASDLQTCAGEGMVQSTAASRLYFLWAELQDWYELRPEERDQAIAAMRRAATEWPTGSRAAGTRSDYLDRWEEFLADLPERSPGAVEAERKKARQALAGELQRIARQEPPMNYDVFVSAERVRRFLQAGYAVVPETPSTKQFVRGWSASTPESTSKIKDAASSLLQELFPPPA